MDRIRGEKRKRQQARVGAPDRALTPNAGMAAITGLCDRLGVIEAIDAAVGPVKQRDRGFGAGQLLTGIAAAQRPPRAGQQRSRRWPADRARTRRPAKTTRPGSQLCLTQTTFSGRSS